MFNAMVNYATIDRKRIQSDTISYRCAVRFVYPRLHTWGAYHWKPQHQIAIL